MWIVTVLGGILSVPIQVALGGLLNGVKAKFKVINLGYVIIKDIKVEESIYIIFIYSSINRSWLK